MIAFLILLSGAAANGSDLDTEIGKAEGNIVPIDLNIVAPDIIVIKKGETKIIPINATIPLDDYPNVKMAIVADGQEAAFYATGQAILSDGFSALRTGEMSLVDDSGKYVKETIFFELTPAFDIRPGNYTLAAVLGGQNSGISKYFRVNVLNNFEEGFPITNMSEVYHLAGNYYTPNREREYQNFNVPYKISNGTLKEIKVDQLNEWLALDIKSTNDGVIEIDIPRNLFDQKINRVGDLIDDEFFVLIDGREVDYNEFKTPCFRNLSIKFQKGTELIEIAGMNLLMGPEPFASEVSPIYLVTNSKNYTKGETITIFGCTSLDIDEKKMVFDISDPEGKNLKSETIEPNLDGTFLYKLDTRNEFVIDGDYTIQATYGNHTNTRTVTVPEYPIASLILVASMVTILIIARKWAQNKTMMVP